jgi:tetratricopeptide (TPR) repeat protein
MTACSRLARAAALCAVLLAACTGSDSREPPPPSDPGLEGEWRLARYALQEGQTRQAVVLYERVLARAYARDDAGAIGDVGYESALALLRDGEPRQAAERARQIRLELERRGADVFAELFLVEAVARYEAGEAEPARVAAEAAIARARPDDPATRARANFILGLLAADAGDADGAARALRDMGEPAQDPLRADAQELRGRWLMLQGRAEAARPAFVEAARIRRELRDYVGMATAMAAGAAAAEAAGDGAGAADLYYRAGRSAAARDDDAKARTWLSRALDLAVENDLATIEADCRDQLRALDG